MVSLKHHLDNITAVYRLDDLLNSYFVQLLEKVV